MLALEMMGEGWMPKSAQGSVIGFNRLGLAGA
jgi:hypothetical protein